MTEASHICNLIHDNPDNWREIIKDKKVIVKEMGDLAIFNYMIKAKFNDPIVREARGIIINTKEMKVVCWPFTKFTEYDDKYADTIDWSSARVEEKIDGSIIKLWYNKLTESWVFSTNSMIYAHQAELHQNKDNDSTFMDLIRNTATYWTLKSYMEPSNPLALNRDYTYIFEITNPDIPVCIRYPESIMYHLGTRSNITGEEIYSYLKGIPHPITLSVNSLEDCINLSIKINNNSIDNIVHECMYEGFVVVDNNWNRIKIKSPIYLILHDSLSGSTKSKKLLLQMIHEKTIDAASISQKYPEVAHVVKYYDFKYTELIRDLTIFVEKTRKLYSYIGRDKKELANRIPECRFKFIAFKCIDNDKDIFELLELGHRGVIGMLDTLIPSYSPNKYEFNYDSIWE